MTRWLIVLVLCGTGLVALALLETGCDDIFLRGSADGAGAAAADGGQPGLTDSCPQEAWPPIRPPREAGSKSGAEAGKGGGSDLSSTGGALPMVLSPIGSPTWKLECTHAFAAACGSKASSFSAAPATIQKVLPGHLYFPAQNVMGPGTPHAQFGQEIAAGLAAAGLTPRSSFSAADLQPPSCIFLMLQLVPSAGAPVGSSVDFASGPILDPNDFPLLVDGSLVSGGKLVDPALDFEYPAKKSLAPEPSGQSYSHIPLVFFENSELVQPQPGTYAFELRIIDALKQGWNVSVSYSVK